MLEYLLFGADWEQVFIPSAPLIETVARGSLMYLFIFLLMRGLLRRQPGALGIADLLVVVLIADAAQNGMAGEYLSITEGALLIGTVVFWDFALNWLGYKVPGFNRLIVRPPKELVRNGRVNRKVMEEELITEEELMSSLRQQGISDLREVGQASIESNGHISVTKRL
ncbi:MAG: YetF domain-containing protein [Dehalococcoidia bacterium]